MPTFNITELEMRNKKRFGHTRRAALALGYDIIQSREAKGDRRFYLEDEHNSVVFPEDHHALASLKEILEFLDARAAEKIAEMDRET